MSKTTKNESASLSRKVVGGSLVMSASRIAIRLVGLASVAVTARILAPDDFGVIGTAAIAIAFFELLEAIGNSQVLVRIKKLDREHIHSVWTLRLMVLSCIAAAIFFSADFVSQLLQEPRVGPVLSFMCLLPLINALASPAPPLLAREFQFKKLFLLQLIHKTAASTSAVIMVLIIGNYWGLVYGQLIGAISFVVASHVFMPYLPKPGLKRLQDIASFSFWSLWRAVGTYLTQVADEIVIRRISNTETFGFYHVSRDLSRSLVAEMIVPAALPLLAGLARVQDELPRFAASVTAALSGIALVAIPVGLGCALIAPELVTLLIGDQWTAAVPIFQYLAPGIAFHAMSQTHREIYAAIDKQHLAAATVGLRALFLGMGCAAAAALFGGPQSVALAFTTISIISTVLDYALLYRFMKAPYPLLSIFKNPIIAGAVMTMTVIFVTEYISLPILLILLVKVTVGAASYLGTVFLLWTAAGRKNSIEKKLFSTIWSIIRKV